jgi:hypothetical protein
MAKAPDPVAAAANTAPVAPKKPQPLTRGETIGAIVLFVAGLLLLGLTLYGFSNTDSNFIFKSKEVTTTEAVEKSSEDGGGEPTPQGSEPPATKTTEEVDFADTVVIFALTAGAALTLGGAFYGRLRSLKLGGLELDLIGSEEEQKVADKAAEKIKELPSVGPQSEPVAVKAAQQVAVAKLRAVAAAGVKPTDSLIEGIASQAAESIAQAVQ